MDYSISGMCSRFFEYIDMKCIASVLSVELAMLLMAAFKGQGEAYLPIVLLLMVVTVLGCIVCSVAKADKRLLVIVVVLLNLGFLVQQIQNGKESQSSTVYIKLLVALASAVLVSFVYSYIAKWLSRDFVILSIMTIQLGICGFMIFAGEVVGEKSIQAAVISAHGITPFEYVKILYIFVAAGLLCKEEENIRILGNEVKRNLLLLIHTALLSISFILCSELGTLLIIYITALLMFYIYGAQEKLCKYMMLASGILFSLVWLVCDKFLLTFVIKNSGVLPGVIEKMVYRFGVACHPELYMNDYGYQGTLGLMSIAVGGLFGIGSERYRLNLPEANNDFIFANVVETCGVLIGFCVVIFFLAFLKRSMVIAEQCCDSYFRGIVSAISIVIISESVIHIGYNMALLPITGIPLYFLSQGFSAIVTSMCLVAILLVISSNNAKKGAFYYGK